MLFPTEHKSSFLAPLITSEQQYHLKSSHNRSHNVEPLHSIWLLVFGPHSISYINAAFAERRRIGVLNDEWTDGRRKRMGMEEKSFSESLHVHPSYAASEMHVCISVGSLLAEMPTHANISANNTPLYCYTIKKR